MGVNEIVLVEDFEQVFTTHFAWIASGRTEETQETGSFAVLSGGDVLQIVGRPVEDVAVEVINDHVIRTRTEPSRCHKEMTVFVLKIAHEGVMRTRAIGEGASACAGLLEHRFNLT